MHAKPDNLEKQAITGTIWVFLERIALELFRFVTTMVLARILGPKDFGLVALTLIFTSIAITFIDSGFTKALIQKRNTNITDESTIFYFNVIVSLIFVILINLFAASIARYYHEVKLENIIRVLSLTLIVFAFGQIQQTILTKIMNFKLQFKANVIGSLCSGTVGILLAYNGYGVWSLVIQSLLDSILKSIIIWILSSWRPIWVFSFKSIKELFGFGINLFFNDLLKALTENMYGLLIGKYYTSYNLGLYDRGNKISSIIITNFQYSIQKVTFPLFSKVQNDKVVLKKVAKKSLDLILFLVVPGMILLAVIATPLTILLLSNKWIEIVPFIQLFCIYWLFFPFSGVNNHLVLALGLPKIILKQSFIIYGLQILSLLITLKLGIYWIIVGQIISNIIRQFVLIYYAKILIKFGFREQGKIFLKYLLISSVAIAPTYIIQYYVLNSMVQLALQASIGLILYFFLAYIFKCASMMLIVDRLPSILNFKR